jgi:hypothetical protein
MNRCEKVKVESPVNCEEFQARSKGNHAGKNMYTQKMDKVSCFFRIKPE